MNGARNSQNGPGDSSEAKNKLLETQAQVDEVVGILRNNVEKLFERELQLLGLDNLTDALQTDASQLESKAVKLKRKMWWKNKKMMIILSSIGAFILILILYTAFSS
ncbi:synaptobrevin-like [Planococcus citri]|uniref:synaptobrevin-like n=1 Tax=Planococcus citri TaxID=170843 RepID=UPI0031F8E023